MAGIPPSIYFPSKTRPQPDLCPDLRGLPPSPAAGRVTGWGPDSQQGLVHLTGTSPETPSGGDLISCLTRWFRHHE
ncbi:unnamed protein product [Boreogadus saida]